MIPIDKIKIPSFVLDIIDELTAETGMISIWLIGSRANGNAKITSDWDILVFSNKKPFYRKIRHEYVDVVRVGPSGNAQLEGETHVLQFSSWKWNQTDKQTATYIGNRFIDYPGGVRDAVDPIYKFNKRNAICLWYQ